MKIPGSETFVFNPTITHFISVINLVMWLTHYSIPHTCREVREHLHSVVFEAKAELNGTLLFTHRIESQCKFCQHRALLGYLGHMEVQPHPTRYGIQANKAVHTGQQPRVLGGREGREGREGGGWEGGRKGI